MTFEFLYLLKLLRCLVIKAPVEPPSENISWEKFTEVAQNHKLLSVIYPLVLQLPKEHQPPSEMLAQWKQFSMVCSVRELKKSMMLTDVLKKAAEKQFCVVLMKGPLMGNLYPEPHARITSDADILIKESEQQAVGDLLFSLAYELEEGLQNSNEITYVKDIFRIEVHTSLWEETEGPRYEALTALHMDDFDSIVATEVNTAPVYRLSTDNSLIYLFYHLIKHFFVSGIGVRYLVDMTLFIREYQDEIDWAAFWKKCEIAKYTKFCKGFLYLCVQYLGLEQEVLKGVCFNDEDKVRAEKLLSDICIGGHNGRATAERNGVSRFIQLYYNEKMESLSIFSIFRQVFGRMDGEGEQDEARNEPVDTKDTTKKQSRSPFWWIKKICSYIPTYIKNTKERGTLWARVRGIKKRSRFLDDLDLMN